MSKVSAFRRSCIVVTPLVALGLAMACATSKRHEPAGSGTSVNPTTQLPAREYAQAPAEAEGSDDAKEVSPQPPAAAPAPEAVQPTVTEHSSRAAKPTGGARPAAAARAPSFNEPASAPKKSGADKKASIQGEERSDLLAGPNDEADPLLPSTKDSSELRVALQDWQIAATQLTTSRGCDDGCRAFQSMQRAASRICNLVISQDPNQRCATAKSRVQSAERDISQRCGKCEH